MRLTPWPLTAIRGHRAGCRIARVVASARSRRSDATSRPSKPKGRACACQPTKVGSSTAVSWPEGVGGKGNEGVAAYVQRIKGSIGYVEYAYAKKNKMAYAQLQNRDGSFVQPDDSAFSFLVDGEEDPLSGLDDRHIKR